MHRSIEPRHLVAMTRYANDLAQAYPHASPEALADKLLTVFHGCDRPTRLHVAAAALGVRLAA